MKVKFAETKKEIKATIKLANTNKTTRTFPNLWTRWGNWTKNPPVIVMLKKDLAAFHAVTFNTRNPYVNSYYVIVDPAFRGIGVGGETLEFILQVAKQRGNTRLKLKTPKESPGKDFWTGFGLKPLYLYKGEYRYDIDIKGCGSVEELLAKPPDELNSLDTVPDSQMKTYLKECPELGGG